MKKYIFLTIFILLALTVLPAFAGQPTEFEIPEIGTEIKGFKVTEVSYWDEYDTTVVKLEHIKTASVLYWLANDNIDRSYRMAFRTPVNDNTGIAHVFEHATLSGSNKYPGANTFFEMIAKTSNTFLNAQTGQYYTMYPMASTSEAQLLKYVDFYMNGLTEPLAVSNKYAMMREAYRYELDDPEGEINLQGVVYSEMLGALSQSRRASYNYQGMIWPGSYAASISGGDPKDIPNLTLDAIRAFHETYYHPGNATMYLTGDVYLPDFLELLHNDFLSKYEYRELSIEDSNYTPLEPGYYEQVFSYPAEEGAPVENAAIIYYGMPFEISDYTDMEALDYVCAYMNDESSPLQRMFREQLPEASVSMTTDWNPEGKTALRFTGMSINESDKDTFKAICDEALAELLENGVNEEVLNGILVSKRFEELMELDNSSVYLNLTEQMVVYWAIFGDRDAWKLSRDFSNNLTTFVTVENLNQTARQYWSDLDTAVMAITVPVPGLKEENDAALRSQLDEMKETMTPEEINALVEETKAFHAFVEESNRINMPKELNALTAATLPEEVSYTPAAETKINGLRVITSEIESPLIHVSIRLDSSMIPFEDLFDYTEFHWLLENVGTDLYSREELPAKQAAVSTGMTMYGEVTENPETRDLESFFEISWYALPETLEESFALVEDILYHADFSDYDYIRSDAAQNLAMAQASMDANGLSLALKASASAWSDLPKYHYYLNNENQLTYWERLSRMSDEEMDALTEKFAAIRDMLLNKNGAVLTVMGNYENIIRSAVLGYQLIGKFSDSEFESVDYASQIEDLPLHNALVTGGNVVYNLSSADMEATGYDRSDGGIRVISKILDDKLLYPELRVKNSAYGGYSTIISNADYIFLFYSYRDPKIAETYAVYETAGDFLRNLQMDDAELEDYITSVYGDLTSPVGPLSAAMIGIEDKVNGEDTYEKTLKMIRDIKAFTPQDIAKYADLADATGSKAASRATAGAKSMIEANAELFDSINYDLMSSGSRETDEAFFDYRFANAEEAAEMLLANREYYENLSQNDLNYRMQKPDATLEELEAFTAEQTRAFTPEEMAAIDDAMAAIEEICREQGYTLPATDGIVFAKTTMLEECGAGAYTHGTEIYIGESVLQAGVSEDPIYQDWFRELIAHELFHCLTRNHPDFRADMYGILSFTVVAEDYDFPQEIRDIIISNPDVEHHNSYAAFEIDGEIKDCTVIFTSKPFEKPGDSFFDEMVTGLVPVDDLSVWYTSDQAANFQDVFGMNTGYVIDPEETLADNFSFLLIEGPDGEYETPEIVEQMDAYLKE